MIYLDSPAGVGLSYSDTRSDYVTNDTATAADANVFLRRFFQVHAYTRDQGCTASGMPGIKGFRAQLKTHKSKAVQQH